MTENEIKEATIEDAIYCAKAMACIEVCEECRFYRLCHTWCDDVYKLIVDALEEVQSYRAIGTVEEIYSMLKVLNRTVSEIHSEVSKYQSIGTIEEFKALKEKNTPKKVAYQGEHEKCPTCGSFHVFGNYCTECGQRLNWGMKNEIN